MRTAGRCLISTGINCVALGKVLGFSEMLSFSGSQPGVTLPLKGDLWQCLGALLVVTTGGRGLLLASSK